MFRWIAKLKSLLAFKKALWRDRHVKPDAAYCNRAVREAMERFPHDRIHREAKAESELFLRRVLGRRTHDA